MTPAEAISLVGAGLDLVQKLTPFLPDEARSKVDAAFDVAKAALVPAEGSAEVSSAYERLAAKFEHPSEPPRE